MAINKAQQSEISALLVALKESASDPATFSILRAKLLALHFEGLDSAELIKLQDKQAQIEAMVTVSGFNQASVNLLLDELSASANLLNSVIRSIDD
jgi:hypothetical protein